MKRYLLFTDVDECWFSMNNIRNPPVKIATNIGTIISICSCIYLLYEGQTISNNLTIKSWSICSLCHKITSNTIYCRFQLSALSFHFLTTFFRHLSKPLLRTYKSTSWKKSSLLIWSSMEDGRICLLSSYFLNSLRASWRTLPAWRSSKARVRLSLTICCWVSVGCEFTVVIISCNNELTQIVNRVNSNDELS